MDELKQIEERLAQIATEKDAEGADIESLLAETKELLERKAIIEAETRKAELDAVVSGELKTEVIKEFTTEERKMDAVEIRKSDEYAKAFLGMIKSGDDTECRSLLSTNASSNGSVPIPEYLETEIKNAWAESKIMSLVKTTNYKGNVKVGFEVSATGAAVHVEGNYNAASADNPGGVPAEETLVWGVAELKAENIKKWITISDEAIEGTTLDTLGEIYKEVAQRIVEEAEQIVINKIVGAPTTSSATSASVAVITATSVSADTIVNAEVALGGRAKDLYIAMNRQTYANFVSVANASNYAVDVFDGLKDKIVFTDALPSFATATTGETFAIVGDFGYGVQANKPNGDDVKITLDEYSLAEKDLVKVIGKQYVGIAVVAPKAFTKITKGAQSS